MPRWEVFNLRVFQNACCHRCSHCNNGRIIKYTVGQALLPNVGEDSEYEYVGTEDDLEEADFVITNRYREVTVQTATKNISPVTDNDSVIYNQEEGFTIKSGVKSVGCIGKYANANLMNEPLTLTETGVFAILGSSYGEKFANERSYFVNHCINRCTDHWLLCYEPA